MLHVSDTELTVPGKSLGIDLRHDLNCFVDEKAVYATVSGLAKTGKDNVRIVPLKGSYLPCGGDLVIGVVTEVLAGGWFVDIDSPYSSYISGEEATSDPLRTDLRRFYEVGDVVSGIVSNVNEVFSFNIIKPWKLLNGLIVNVNPVKIPRVIGKKRSMLNMIKDKTGCKIVVGQNGLVWIKGDRIQLVIDVLRRIERESHIPGLTNRISTMLDDRLR